MRICLVYDCLFPYTVGGAERWYRNLVERLAQDGHDVTYLTLRQWNRSERPDLPGVRVRAVGPRMSLYTERRRSILPPLVFGAGVLAHLSRTGDYDVVHTASFPYFSLLAAAAARRLSDFRLVVDWHELWTREYWGDYLGPVAGRVGWEVQRRCVRVPHRAFCFSRLHMRRLHELGFEGEATLLEGEYAEGRPALDLADEQEREPVVVFAGRHIPEKRIPALVEAIALARRSAPDVRGEIFGDGPERPRVLEAIRDHRLEGVIEAPGFVPAERIESRLGSAMCMVLPSRREGYGLIVIEAAARGTPSVVVRGPDNAATELVIEGENGIVADPAPSAIADAILRIHAAGASMRRSTASWFNANAKRLSLESSLERVLAAYAQAPESSARS